MPALHRSFCGVEAKKKTTVWDCRGVGTGRVGSVVVNLGEGNRSLERVRIEVYGQTKKRIGLTRSCKDVKEQERSAGG